MYTKGSCVSRTQVPGIAMRLLIILVMVLTSFSTNYQIVNAADDGTEPQGGEEFPTEIPTEEIIQDVPEEPPSEPTEEPAVGANVDPTDEPTLEPTETFTEEPVCYALTLSHSGNGSDLLAEPANSAGCLSGEYVEDEIINLSEAVPDDGWEIDGWVGTVNDTSTADSNSLMMPASETTVSVVYSEIKVVALEEEVEAESAYTWKAYNDGAYIDGQISTNITTYESFTNGDGGLLMKYADGTNTAVTVAVNTSGTVSEQISSSYSGAETDAGTDAYTTFHDYVNIVGGARLGTASSFITLTFTGLDTSKTYTFATTANRADSDYSDRVTIFTISDIDAATNDSTSGTDISTTSITNDTTSFCTGYNTENGYVARWTGIQPGPDGDFMVKFSVDSPDADYAYGPSAFLLAEESGEPVEQYTLEVTDDGNGSVTLSPSGGIYDEGMVVTLTPIPNTSYTFNSWSGADASDVTYSSDKYEITMDADKSITANFVESAGWVAYNDMNPYSGDANATNVTEHTYETNDGALVDYNTGTSLNATVTGSCVNGSGTVVSCEDSYEDYGGQTNSGTDAADVFGTSDSVIVDLQNMVQLTDANYDDIITLENLDPTKTYNITVTTNRDSSSYASIRFTKVTIVGAETYINASSSGVVVNSEDSVSFSTGYNTVNGYVAKWTGITTGSDGSFSIKSERDESQGSGSSNTKGYAMTAFRLEEVSEAPEQYTLSIGNDGNGSVDLSPSGGTYDEGTIVTLTPVPSSGFIFSSWSGTNSGDLTNNGDGTYSITMNADKDVTANFEATILKTLTVTTDGNGTVSFNPAGGAYDEGTVVTLTPAAFSGFAFSSWSGADSDDVYDNLDGTYSINMDTNKVLVANFIVIPQYTLTVSTDGNGSVTLSPGGGTYDQSTVVILTPTPNTNYMFSSWGGPDYEDVMDNLDGTYSITMDEAKAITANFIIENEAPTAPVLVQPADSTINVSISPTLEVTVTDPEADLMDVTFYGRATGSGTGEDFTLVAIPDTQNLVTSSSGAAIFNTMTQWIVDNKTTDNIVFTTHLGDIVNATSTSQSEYADAAMDILDTGNVSYSVGPGNHDLLSGSLYSTYFGSARFSGKSYYQGDYSGGSDNYNNYSFFAAGGMDFIIINMQYNAGTSALAWADGLLKTYSDKRAIVVQHDMLSVTNGWVNQATYNALKNNPNLFLMLCGHMHTSTDGAAYVAGIGDSGQTIHVILTDYQDYSNGYIKLLEFQPSEDEIEVTTYSPNLNTYLTGSEEVMSLVYEMDASSAFEVIGTANGVASGDSASMTWEDLSNETEYEWYAVVSDGISSTNGDTWSFTTGTAITNNDPVIAESDPQSVSMSEDGSPNAFSLTLNASDLDGDTLTWSVANEASHGSASASGIGSSISVGYTPDVNYNGLDSFVVRVSDGKGGVDTITVNVDVIAVNDAPVANAQVVTTAEDTAKAITLTGSDVDGDSLSYSVVDSPTHGILSGTPPNLTYTPTENYNGSDSFTFKVNDGTVESNVATVSITVSAMNDAPVITEGANTTITMSEDGSPIAFELTLNATDVDEDMLTWGILTDATFGSAAASGTGASKVIQYAPNSDHNGSDYFVVQVTDGDKVDTITVNVTISPINDAPVANAQSVVVDEDIAKDITLIGTDVDGDALNYTAVASPVNGTLSGSAPNLTYTPNPEFSGADSFTFKVDDGDLESGPATVSIIVNNVNDAPVISESDPQYVSMSEDGSPIAFELSLNATDAEDDTLTWSIAGDAVNGTASASGIGSSIVVGYTPDANYSGEDSFIVQVSDGNGVDTITVNVTIAPINDLPVITESDPQNISMSEDGFPTEFALTLNASDVDEDVLTWSILTDAVNGTASASGNGSSIEVEYAAGSNYFGSDSFVMQVSDGSGVDTITMNVTIDAVNDAPVCSDVTLNTFANMEWHTAPDCTDIEGDSLTYSIVDGPAYGTGSVVDDLLTYMPGTDYSGADSFTYQANDGEANSNAAEVIVTVNESNQAPVCTATELITDEDTAGQTDPICTDHESSPLTYSIAAQPVYGTAAVVEGQLVYTPAANFNGSDSFTYTANDGFDDSEATEVSVTVNAVNDAPECMDTNLNTNQNTQGTVEPQCVDVDEDVLSYSIVTQPSHSSVSVRNGKLVYLPGWNYAGTDSFVYKASDGITESGSAIVSVTVSDDALPTRAPSTPALASPPNKGLMTDLAPRLDWSNSKIYSGTAFDHYQVQVATDEEFTAVVVDEDVAGQTSSEYTLESPLNTNTRYFWRVRAFNSFGQFSSWASARYFREAIEAPELTSPTNAIYLDNLRPEFDWEDVEGASGYTIQISARTNMGSPTSGKVTDSSYIPTKDLSKNKTLYWRMRTEGENGPSEWSEVRTMVTPNTPATPKLISPKNKALVTDLMPTLDWRNSAAPNGTIFDHYQVQVATDEDFTAVVVDEEITGQTSSEYTLESVLNPNTRYYWRVRAFNTLGQYGSWSTAYYFREAVEAPELNSPVDGIFLDNLRPEFDWENVIGASSYTIQISARTNMGSPISGKVTDSSYVPVKDLSKNKTLYWRVRTEGENGPSEWSEVRIMVTPNTPTTPKLISPKNKALVTDLMPKFDWSNSAVPYGTIFDHYQVQVATDEAFAAVVVDKDVVGLNTDSEYTLRSALNPNTRYYWRVRAFNTLGQYGSWSKAYYFREAMEAPGMVHPEDGVEAESLQPQFEWEAVEGASSYTIQLSTRSNMKSASSKTVQETQYCPTKNLSKGKTYYWRVRANGENGPSTWSEVREIVMPNS